MLYTTADLERMYDEALDAGEATHVNLSYDDDYDTIALYLDVDDVTYTNDDYAAEREQAYWSKDAQTIGARY